MNRTYRLKHWANRGKQTKILAVFKEYRLTAKRIADHQWYLFFSENGFNKNHQVKDITSALSERYKQVCQYQVVGMLESYISNRKNDFINHVYNSSLTGQAKLELLYINKYGLWFRNNVKIPVFNNNGKKIKGKHKTIDTATIKLSRKIFKHILSKHRKPTMKHINMEDLLFSFIDRAGFVVRTSGKNIPGPVDIRMRVGTTEFAYKPCTASAVTLVYIATLGTSLRSIGRVNVGNYNSVFFMERFQLGSNKTLTESG
jgi:sRNA-binding regulator protein Hfq